MPILDRFAPPSPLPMPDAAAPLALTALDAALRDAAGDAQAVRRVEADVPPVDVLAWLAAQTMGPAVAWQSRGSAEACAAVGAALIVESDSLAGLALPDLPPDARLYGAARFAPTGTVGPEWAAFGRVRFVLPRVELRSDGRTARLAVHLAPGESAAAGHAALAALRAPSALAAWTPPASRARADAPDRTGWTHALHEALSAIAHGALGKVVLARRSERLLDAPVDPVALLARLAGAAPRRFRALVQPTPGGPAFVSASPERLFRLDGRRVQTEAVAGTRPRDERDADDDRLLADLLGSEKDQREHRFVVDAVARRLAPLSTHFHADAHAQAMTLARGRHLLTPIEATLRPGVGALDVLRALHPTPAVGGTPRRPAEAAIACLEPFDRGLYAGPIGWIGRDADGAEAAELAVGIRSALVDGPRVALYSGAGIVAGSEPDAEWDEIEHKTGDLLRALGLGEG